jgi:hypothetical protein
LLPGIIHNRCPIRAPEALAIRTPKPHYLVAEKDNMKRMFVLLAVLGFASISDAKDAIATSGQAALPGDPTTAILNAFESYRVVALDEGRHGNEQGQAFRLALHGDPDVAATRRAGWR